MKRIHLIIVVVLVLAAIGCRERYEGKVADGPYLILYAFAEEGELLAKTMTIEKTDRHLGRTVHVGKLAGKPVVLAASGIGMTNAAMTTQRMIDIYNPKAVLFSGIAGGIDSAVHIGDIVVAGKWVEHDYGYVGADGFEYRPIGVYVPVDDSVYRMDGFPVDSVLSAVAGQVIADSLKLESIGERAPQLVLGGIGASGNSFIDSREKREWLFATFRALVVDMESAAVAQVCLVNNKPVLIFRSASDLAGGSGSETADVQLEQFFQVAASNSAKVVMATLERLPLPAKAKK